MDRVQVVMLRQKDSLFVGENLNMPAHVARELVASGYAKLVTDVAPEETKVVAPVETKVVTPGGKKQRK